MDLANYNLTKLADAGFDMPVLEPYTGEKTDAVITVIGSDSKTYRAAKSKLYRKAVDPDVNTDDLSAEVYSKCITGWSGIESEGKAIEFSQETAFKLLSDLPWLLDQVSIAVEKRANFTKKPAKS